MSHGQPPQRGIIQGRPLILIIELSFGLASFFSEIPATQANWEHSFAYIAGLLVEKNQTSGITAAKQSTGEILPWVVFAALP